MTGVPYHLMAYDENACTQAMSTDTATKSSEAITITMHGAFEAPQCTLSVPRFERKRVRTYRQILHHQGVFF